MKERRSEMRKTDKEKGTEEMIMEEKYEETTILINYLVKEKQVCLLL